MSVFKFDKDMAKFRSRISPEKKNNKPKDYSTNK